MRWTTSNIVSGMQALLSKGSEQHSRESDEAFEDIRRAMLDELAICAYRVNPILQMRVTDASDVQDLWYLRGDLMAAIAANEGEVAAKRKVSHISNMFRGLLPKGLSSRPSPLGD